MLHLLDMVELAMAHAMRPQRTRIYESSIVRGERREDVIDASLTRDHERILSWQIDQATIVAAPPYDSFPRHAVGAMKRKAVEDWLRDKLDEDAREAVLVLHRALFVSDASYFDWNSPRSSADNHIPSLCFTHHPARAASAYPTPLHFRHLSVVPSSGDDP